MQEPEVLIQGESDRTVWNKKQGNICQAGSGVTGGSALSHSDEQNLGCLLWGREQGEEKGCSKGKKKKGTNSKKVALFWEGKKEEGSSML